MADTLPDIAISVRQPWAWAILHAGKDVENRSTLGPWRGLIGQRVAIHAAKGMTQAEYADAVAFMAALGVTAPPPADLVRGAIVGSVKITGYWTSPQSPWFAGPYGLVVKHPQALRVPIACSGALGAFAWRERAGGKFDPPKRWMSKVGGVDG